MSGSVPPLLTGGSLSASRGFLMLCLPLMWPRGSLALPLGPWPLLDVALPLVVWG